MPVLLTPALLALVLAPAASSPGRSDQPSGADGQALPPGLLLRYADGGLELGISNLVATWPDTLGSGLDLVQGNGRSKPWRAPFVAAGRPAVHFDGNDYVVRDQGMPAGSQSRAFAVRVDDLKGGGVLLGAGVGNAVRFAYGSPYLRFEQGGEALVAAAPVPLGAFVTLLTTWDAATGAAEIYVEGALVAQGVLPPLGDDALAIGATKQGGWPLTGYVAEILVFDHVLTEPERHTVHAYLGDYADAPFPEVEIAGLPRDAQVLQRDAFGFGKVEISGVVKTPGLQYVGLRVLRAGAVYDLAYQALAYGPDGAPFELAAALEAGMFDHELQVLVAPPGGTAILVEQRINVVAGDTFLVDGQSNAVAKDWKAEGLGDLHQSHWIRSFGDARYVLLYIPPIVVSKADHNKDLHWDVATSLLPHGHATIGQWSLRMAEVLMEGLQVPIAVINGGVEGSSIKHHLRNDLYPTDPAGIYGRMLYRAQQAGLEQDARALIYYQGETDGLIPLVWKNGFDSLVADWLFDYPGLERIYCVQIREGCGIFNEVVREIQRTLPYSHPEVTTMSTTAVPTHDGCHYYHGGYLEIGQRMSAIVARDLYGGPASNVAPPQIVKAAWESAQKDALILTFDPPGDALHADPGVTAHTTLSDGTPVVEVKVFGQNQLRVGLAGPSTATFVSWSGHAYDGPWITNANGVGALTFFQFPIDP